MSKFVSMQALKFSFVHYLMAFFLGRLASRILGKGLEALNFGPSAGASQANVLMYFYLSAFIGLVVMALAAAWIFTHLKKIDFSISLFIALAAVYSISGVAGVAGMLNGFYPPQAVLAIIPIQFLIGWFLVAKHVQKLVYSGADLETSSESNKFNPLLFLVFLGIFLAIRYMMP